MSARAQRAGLATTAAALGVLLVVAAANSVSWIERPFPGFLVMANRVVPSIALPAWADGRAAELFQHQVLAVGGAPVATAAAVYAAAAAAGPERVLAYELRAPLGANATREVTTRTFTANDYVYLFGAYLLNGLLFCSIGLLVLWLKPRAAAGWGLGAATLSTGVFVITAADLYGPFWFFRLHVAAETLMAAGFLHLALVFPTDRIRGRSRAILGALYGSAGVAVVAYEAVLWNPSAYTAVHLGVLGAQVLGCAATIAAIVHDFVRSRSPLVRRRIGVVALGATVGMIAPVGLWATSAALGGAVPMNWAALTAFCFPLSVAYAVLHSDLFEIDVVVRRAATYVGVVAVTVAAYVLLLAAGGALVGGAGVLAQRPAVFVAANVALLFLLVPIRARIQKLVDGLFFRLSYDAQAVVASLGHALERALHVREVVAETRRVLLESIFPRHCLVLAAAADGRLSALPGEASRGDVVLPGELVERLAAGAVLTRYEWDDGGAGDLPRAWVELEAELLVPVRRDGGLEYVVVLGGKESGRAYNLHDSAVLRTIAGQISLAMATARAFEELAALNASLEQQVTDRTEKLAETNRELQGFLTELNEAYVRLEQNQKSLLRADRLATLGRLVSGIAHEINTPLAALMNALEMLGGLGREYAESIDDASVTAGDHREIAGEIARTVATAEGWATRAATYIGRIKSHGHETERQDVRRFSLGEALDEVAALLDHRLRASLCTLDVDDETRAVQLLGDLGRLVHVLLNVVDNAIGAHEEIDEPEGPIQIRARDEHGVVVLTVRDHATGVTPEIAGRIFDELFTTKERGKGTGLGLWIARNIVEQSFGGTLELVPVDGRGACFRARLAPPRVQLVQRREEPPARAQHADMESA